MPASEPDFASALAASFEDLRERFAAGVAAARASERREITAQLNNAVRRLRQSETSDIWVRNLLDAVAPFCVRAACFRLEGSRALLLEGASEDEAGTAGLEFELDTAPAFANAAESNDVVVTAAAPGQLSEDVLSLMQPEGQKLFLFPLVKGGRTVAVLCADPGETGIDISAIELLTSTAGVSFPVPERPRPAGLISIARCVRSGRTCRNPSRRRIFAPSASPARELQS
jgi:hypothetical protein